MAVAQIKMPQLGESVTEGTVDHWLKAEGDFVKRDEPLVEVVTDKVNAEIPSPFEGKLLKIAVTAGETVQVGAVIAQIETGVAAPAADPGSKAASAPAKERETGVAHTEVPPEPSGGRAPQPVAQAQSADGGTEQAGPGFVAHFDPQERRTVRARSDTRLIMVLAPWPGAGHPSQAS